MFKTTITAMACALALGTSAAGNMHTTTDSFTGKTETLFQVSELEWLQTGMAYSIARRGGVAFVGVDTGADRAGCTTRDVLVKERTGKIHRLPAQQIGNTCMFLIHPSAIKQSFEVRIPLFPAGFKDAKFNTAGLVFEKLTDLSAN